MRAAEEAPMFERFTDRARRVLVFAEDEARALGHGHIGTEHVLLGLIHEGEGVGATALESLGISLEDTREDVEQRIGRGEDPLPEQIPFTTSCKTVLELALREALQLGHNYIGTEHVLLGLVREGEGVAAQVLLQRGASLAAVRSQVIRTLSGRPGTDPAEEAGPGGGRQAWQEVGWTLLASGTETTWRALGIARQEAALDQHPAVEVSDLVLGVLRTGDAQVTGALAAAGAQGVSPGELAPDDAGDGDPPPLALSVRARDACIEAVRLAGDGAGAIRPAHLLLGCLSVLEDQEADVVGARLGVGVRAIAEQLTRPAGGGG